MNPENSAHAPGENGPERVSPFGRDPESWVIVDPLDGAWRWFDTKLEAQEYWLAACKVQDVRGAQKAAAEGREWQRGR